MPGPDTGVKPKRRPEATSRAAYTWTVCMREAIWPNRDDHRLCSSLHGSGGRRDVSRRRARRLHARSARRSVGPAALLALIHHAPASRDPRSRRSRKRSPLRPRRRDRLRRRSSSSVLDTADSYLDGRPAGLDPCDRVAAIDVPPDLRQPRDDPLPRETRDWAFVISHQERRPRDRDLVRLRVELGTHFGGVDGWLGERSASSETEERRYASRSATSLDERLGQGDDLRTNRPGRRSTTPVGPPLAVRPWNRSQPGARFLLWREHVRRAPWHERQAWAS